MNKKPYVLSVVMSLLSILGYAQVGPDIIRPSVNADQFNTAIKAETALSRCSNRQVARCLCGTCNHWKRSIE